MVDNALLMQIFGGVVVAIFMLFIGAAILDKRKFRQKMEKLFPDCPFKIKNDSEGDMWFMLTDDYVGFQLDHGTRPDGVRGVIGINLSDWPSFRDGMDMLRLWEETNNLVDYLKKQGYDVREENHYLSGIKEEVNKIDNFAYIKAKKAGRIK